MKIVSKRKLLNTLLLMSPFVSLAVVSCNKPTGREIKKIGLSDKEFNSKEFKVLAKIIKDEFVNRGLEKTYNTYIHSNGHINNVYYRTSEIAKSTTDDSWKRALLREKNFVGNFGSGILSSVLNEIRYNETIPIKYRLLLNKITTNYNRTKNVYPTKYQILTNDKYGKHAKYYFRVDLQTSMKRRFMRKFIDLYLIVPLEYDLNNKPIITKLNFNKIFELKDATQIDSTLELKELLKATLGNYNGFNLKILNSPQDKNVLLSSNQISITRFGIAPYKTDQLKVYKPEFTGRLSDVNAPSSYTFKYYFKGKTNDLETIGAFSKTDLVEKLSLKIKEELFTKSKQKIIKDLFGPNGKWHVTIKTKTWAGNTAEKYTVSDFVENIAHRSNYFVEIGHKKDPTKYLKIKFKTGLGRI